MHTEYDQNTVTPLVHEGSIILSGINKGVDRYRIEKTDDEWETDKVWANSEVSLYMSSPVADADKLFGFSHRQKGQLFAIDLTTGKTLWTSEGRLGDNASLVRNRQGAVGPDDRGRADRVSGQRQEIRAAGPLQSRRYAHLGPSRGRLSTACW